MMMATHAQREIIQQFHNNATAAGVVLRLSRIRRGPRRQHCPETEGILYERLSLRKAAAEGAAHPVDVRCPGVTAMFASLHRWPPHDEFILKMSADKSGFAMFPTSRLRPCPPMLTFGYSA
jgi:hypothetical protein